jgi:hypothetical protein
VNAGAGDGQPAAIGRWPDEREVGRNYFDQLGSGFPLVEEPEFGDIELEIRSRS